MLCTIVGELEGEGRMKCLLSLFESLFFTRENLKLVFNHFNSALFIFKMTQMSWSVLKKLYDIWGIRLSCTEGVSLSPLFSSGSVLLNDFILSYG